MKDRWRSSVCVVVVRGGWVGVVKTSVVCYSEQRLREGEVFCVFFKDGSCG